MVGFHSFGAIVAASSIFPLSSWATPIGASKNSLQSRQNDYYVITGIKEGGVQPRLNIRDLGRKPENRDMWTLFLLALERLKARDQQDKLSFYQLAGIHGQPYIPWDGVQGRVLPEGEDYHWGYCTHNGLLFSTWHRPYMMLYEQLIHQYAVEIVGEIKDATVKARYRDAATKLRLPYWDWAETPPAGEHVLPDSIAKPTISVTFPNNTVATIDNPLFDYRFHPKRPEDFKSFYEDDPYGEWDKTFRFPDKYPSAAPTDNLEANINRIDSNLGWARSRLMLLYTNWLPFNRFSNQAPGGDDKIGNLETVHGTIHSTFSQGTMERPDTAAYDPVFWLHHANVDRQLAIWQALYPDTYVTPGRSSRQNTFTLDGSAEEPIGDFTPLHPFHRNTEGDFWTSALVRDTTKLGYTYPELVGNPSNATLKAKIRTLYDDSVPAQLSVRQEGGGEKTVREYRATVKMPAGFVASLFLGEPESTPIDWPLDDRFTGSFSTMFDRMASNDESFVFTSVVTLSAKIAGDKQSGKLKSDDESAVVEYLKTNLKLKIEDVGRKVIPASEVPNLKVEVYSQVQTVPASLSEFPSTIETKDYPEISAW
ncbi:Di-copper centre-containing protein [Amniculicola lignicola CBS 123094]|uniref:tyrosinase n=1 Tax=Amniculicola lignicola CBS 123094 TaxID=1392246 RepID=A0A6A5WJZ6_9PLEO|nr:Di-copper centre-containing protein [Amniculicola lignicola CBS 123094]